MKQSWMSYDHELVKWEIRVTLLLAILLLEILVVVLL